ncbi:MAG: hexose kinase [Clostridia bacterium]|nr:hexose kinase [Clostridia bacterium]
MILTICPSPCLDIDIEVDSLSVGKSNSVVTKSVLCTGKALNVAVGLSRLGSESFATGFMYEENSRQFEHYLHLNGVPYKFVWCDGRVRENYKIIDNKGMLTEVNDVSPAVGEIKEEELLKLVTDMSPSCSAVVISGSLPRDLGPEFYGRVLSVVPQNVKKVVDTEGERLFSALSAGGAALVKPNMDELRRTTKMPVRNTHEVLEASYTLLARGAGIVLVSMGMDGAIITDGRRNFFAKSVNVAMNSTLGAGDAMVAGAADALIKGAELKEILLCGMAAGTASVTQPGTISFTKEKYDEVLTSISAEEIFD